MTTVTRSALQPLGRPQSSVHDEVVGLVLLPAFAPVLKVLLCQVDFHPPLVRGLSWVGAMSPALCFSSDPRSPHTPSLHILVISAYLSASLPRR